MYYDMQSDRLYDNESAMEGIFAEIGGKVFNKIDNSKWANKLKAKNEKRHQENEAKTKAEKAAKREQNKEHYDRIKKKYNCETEAKLISLISKFLKDEAKAIKANKELMGKIRTFCKENDCSIPSFNIVYDGEYFIIIDADQEIRIEFDTIVYDLADKLKAKYGELIDAFGYKIGTGDGDEGCIYLEEV